MEVDLTEIFREEGVCKLINRNKETLNFELDLEKLMIQSKKFYDLFLEKPQEVIDVLLDYIRIMSPSIKSFKILNFHQIKQISCIRVSDIKKIVKVVGMISKTTKVIAIVKSKTYECPTCGTTIKSKIEPKRCTCGRRNGFSLIHTDLMDIQEIEIEELQDTLGTKQPQRVRVRFLEYMCDAEISGDLQPGNKIEIIGIVEKVEKNQGKNQDEIFDYRVLALDLKQLDESMNENPITEEDEKRILEISVGDPLKTLSESLAPSIYGHDEIKKALVLQMVGGSKSTSSDGISTRDRIHVLLCGDAGCGKTRLAKSLQKRMPKCYFTSGDEASRAGLTAIVDRDTLLNQWCLKAGALCKCSNSILIIDELDKMDEENVCALHTPMEIGEIHIDKADIHSTLKADCSILAIANPKDGMFDMSNPNLTITKQLNLPPPLLSRFDLIFVMLDVIEKKSDELIADRIFSGSNEDYEVDPELFKKYISFAKKINPKRDPKDKEFLIKFYEEVRRKSVSGDSKLKGMPITTRHFEGILRLASAHARLRLSDKIENQDYEVAKSIFINSLVKLGLDTDSGIIDMARIGSGKTLNKKIKCKTILGIISERLESEGDMAEFEYIKEKAKEHNIDRFEVGELIEELRKSGEIYEPKQGCYSLVERFIK